MPSMRSILFVASLLGSAFAAPRNLPPKISGSVQVLGHTFDLPFSKGNASIKNDPGFYSDGGAPGLVNGYNLLTLSDARAYNHAGLVHTVFAFTSPSNPRNITILGDYNDRPPLFLQGPNGAGQGIVASQSGDDCQGSDFGPAPNTAMIPLGGSKGATVWTVYCGPFSPRYNTLIEFDVSNLESKAANSQNIPATRTVQKLFNVNQPLYGTDGLAIDSTYLYLVARYNQYFKLARVPIGQRTTKSSYRYYYPSSKSWTSTIPSPNDTSSNTNFFTAKQEGNGVQFTSDLFYSNYFQTWLISYNSGPYGGGLYNLAYSTSGNVEGPYTDLPGFYRPPLDEGCDKNSPNYNPATDGSFAVVYSAHSNPGYDTSGKTMTINWISCNTFTNFARWTFV